MESAFCPVEPGLTLIETLGWDGKVLTRLPRHLARLERSAARLGFPCDPVAVRAALQAVLPEGPARVRLTLDAEGRVAVTTGPLAPNTAPWRLGISQHRLSSSDPWLSVKSSRRALYDESRAQLPEDLDELLFLNERDEICEGTITNLFYDLGEGLSTPPLASGLLPGILREELLETGQCRERVVIRAELERARLWVGNSLRGLIPAELGR